MLKLNKNLIITFIIIGGIIIAGIAILLAGEQIFPKEKTIPSIQEIAQRALQYVNATLLVNNQGLRASLIETTSEKGLIKLKFKVGEYETVSYVTSDGKLFFPSAVDLADKSNFPYVIDKPIEEEGLLSEENAVAPEELAKFVECLKKAKFVIYGANWCHYTNDLVAMLGGKEQVQPIYIECTENEDLCKEKGVTGYPTIIINGKEFNGSRSLTGFSEVTGCLAPGGR